ncbi:MAG: hypothetical protein ACYDGR_02515 [Candidatus Dormibacteria bacterium]
MTQSTGSDLETPDQVGPAQSFPVRLAYGVYGAMSADLGCIIGAVAFFLLVFLSAYFASVLTPCTSAGGIPCAH